MTQLVWLVINTEERNTDIGLPCNAIYLVKVTMNVLSYQCQECFCILRQTYIGKRDSSKEFWFSILQNLFPLSALIP